MPRAAPSCCQTARTCSRPWRSAALRCRPLHLQRAQATADVKTEVGYLSQLREAAMALHTKEQLGQKPSKESKGKMPEPTLVGYLRFLQESRIVWDRLESIIAESDDPNLAPFKSTGLERGPALSKDIQWFHDEKSLGPLPEKPDGPGTEYAQLLTDLANNDVPSFLCHYYNIVFAHNAGGMMIGKSLSKKLLDGETLEFYKYEDDVKKIGAVVKEDLEKVAAEWDPEARQRSIDQTKNTFQYAGSLMRCIVASE